jgi:hypothetical protein
LLLLIYQLMEEWRDAQALFPALLVCFCQQFSVVSGQRDQEFPSADKSSAGGMGFFPQCDCFV